MVLAVTSGVYIVVFVWYNAPTRIIMSVLASRLLIVYSVLFFKRVLFVHSSEEEKIGSPFVAKTVKALPCEFP